MKPRIFYVLAVIAGIALAAYQRADNTTDQPSRVAVADVRTSSWPEMRTGGPVSNSREIAASTRMRPGKSDAIQSAPSMDTDGAAQMSGVMVEEWAYTDIVSDLDQEPIPTEIIESLDDAFVSLMDEEQNNTHDAAGEDSYPDDREGMEEHFVTQYSDSQWMAEMYQALQEAGADSTSTPGISHDLVECKEQICKVMLMYSDKGLIEDYVDNLMSSFKGKQAVSLNFEENIDLDGNTVVDMYVMR